MAHGLVIGLTFLTAATAVFAGLSSKPARDNVREHSFACQGGTEILVSERDSGAAVRVGEKTYQLRPKSSSLGRKFVSAEATLIIDGSFAAFVATDRFNLRECYAQLN
jgi:hypothetical protein